MRYAIALLIVCISFGITRPSTVAADHFGYDMIKERGKGGYGVVDGKPTGHEHAIVHCEGVGLFVLRTRRECRRYGRLLECDQGHFPSIRERAKVVVQRLNDAVEMWEHQAPGAAVHKDQPHELKFETQQLSDGTGIFMDPGHDADPRLIVTVTKGDVVGYRRRSSHPKVTQQLVAAWWVGLSKDIFSLLVTNEPPTIVTKTQRGAILNEVAEHAEEQKGAEGEHHVDLSELPADDRLALKMLATQIPEDFLPDFVDLGGEKERLPE